MKRKHVYYTKLYTAECLEEEVPMVVPNTVMVKMEYTVISGGTEKSVIMGSKNTQNKFPMSLG